MQIIKNFIQNYQEKMATLDYLINHINYHLMNKNKHKSGFELTKFNLEQLRTIVHDNLDGLTDKQADKLINLAISDISSGSRYKCLKTKNSVYFAEVAAV